MRASQSRITGCHSIFSSQGASGYESQDWIDFLERETQVDAAEMRPRNPAAVIFAG